MALNYTQEMVDLMTEKYSANPTRETVEELAEELNKSIKSIIGKLSREGVYKKTEYLTKTGEKPITKKEIVQTLAGMLHLEYEALAGLEKSPKQALKTLMTELQEIEIIHSLLSTENLHQVRSFRKAFAGSIRRFQKRPLKSFPR